MQKQTWLMSKEGVQAALPSHNSVGDGMLYTHHREQRSVRVCQYM
jgi:hypothetical protein